MSDVLDSVPADVATARPEPAPAAAGGGGGFDWIVGIENAYIPDMSVDELGWTFHRERWREDLALARDVGASAIRYGITWPEIELEPGRYTWSWTDRVVDELQRLSLEPIWDMIHFGTPHWMAGGFLDPEYVPAVERFARAFAERYRGHVRRITPMNEPYITTYFRAGWGIWPPHLKGRQGFAQLLRPIVAGLRASIRAIVEAAPEAEIWLNDGADVFHPAGDDLHAEARHRNQERFAAFDLLLGKAVPGQETYEWLVEAGYPPSEIVVEPVPVHVIGLDYYPDTEHDLVRSGDGTATVRRAAEPRGIGRVMIEYHERYGRPLFIAESSYTGTDEERETWLRWNVEEIAKAREHGVDVRGYTWWPLFDHIDWNTLLQERTGFVCAAGLFHLTPTERDRQRTPAADAFRALATGIA